MCNLYSLTINQAAIIALAHAMRDTTSNMPTYPGMFPDYKQRAGWNARARNAPLGNILLFCCADEGR